jgi:TolB-like protein/DNA-binding winged helix-turn-helix (wHTH) protein/Tfp pilus assembly protein PilF
MTVEVQSGKPRIDLSRYELTVVGRRVKLEHQPMELLILLVEKKGQLVTRDDIVARLWGKSTFVDADQSINAAIRKIRSALRDDPAHPKYLETVVSKGYRFIGDIEVVAADASTTQELKTGPGAEPSGSHGNYLRRRTFQLAGLIILLVAIAWGWSRWHERTGPQPGQIHSLAVLPLANLSGDPAQDYFAEGMTDELITELAQIGSLRVISRTSVMRYQGTKKSLPEIAKELRVDGIVEGTVVRSGDKLRITAQLIEAKTDRHLWAQGYERDFRDVLTLQREVAGAIARQVNATLTPTEQTRMSKATQVNSQADEAYLRGLFFWNKWTEDGVRKSIEYYQQAIQADPNYALAHAGLANSYIAMGDFGVGLMGPREANQAAEQSALKAISLDDTLAEGHAALAMSRFRCDGDLSSVEGEFKRAIELNPGSATARHWYSHYLLAMGRAEEAIAEGERAYDLSPVDPEMGVHMQFLYLFLHRYDDVIAQGHKTLELDPNFSEIHFMSGQAYEQEHRYKEAASELQAAARLSGRRSMILASLGHLLAVSGDRRGARKILDELNALSPHRYVPSYEKTLVQVGLGENEEALRALEKAYEEGSHWMFILQFDARLDPLRSDARFQDLVRRVHSGPIIVKP